MISFRSANKAAYEYTIYTDSISIGARGGCGGYGAVIMNNSTGECKELSEGFSSTSRNRMELMAVNASLSHVSEGSSILLYTSSLLLLKCLTGVLQRKADFDLWEQFDLLVLNKTVNVASGQYRRYDPYVKRCSQLAKETIEWVFPSEDKGFLPNASFITEDAVSNELSGVISVTDNPDIMQLPIVIPDNLPIIFTSSIIITVNNACLNAIRLLPQHPSFSQLKNIHVGHSDGWSALRGDDLVSLFSSELIAFVSDYFPDKNSCAACLRWYGRGMKLCDAIRKVYVDLEVSENTRISRSRSLVSPVN